jgi:hypothetical protein
VQVSKWELGRAAAQSAGRGDGSRYQADQAKRLARQVPIPIAREASVNGRRVWPLRIAHRSPSRREACRELMVRRPSAASATDGAKVGERQEAKCRLAQSRN